MAQTTTYPTGQHNYWGIIKVAGGLLAIVLIAVYILNRGSSPVEPPVSTDKVTIEVPATAYFGCIDTSAPIQTYPGRDAMFADTHYVACDTPVALIFDVSEGDSGYILTDLDGDKFACAAIPNDFTGLQICSRVQSSLQSAMDTAEKLIAAVKG